MGVLMPLTRATAKPLAATWAVSWLEPTPRVAATGNAAEKKACKIKKVFAADHNS